MQEQPGGERHGPSSITICPARATSNLLRRPAGVVPTTGSRALKQAAPAVSPALAAIVAAVEASISTFCWISEHPPRAQRMAKILIKFKII
jgi:hypothetical protein